MPPKERIAIYGLSTETERLLPELNIGHDIVGLLDGFRREGTMYGLPILTMEAVQKIGVEKIIVIARPGSCKAIAKRIGGFCKDYGIPLYDVRGNDLLKVKEPAFHFEDVSLVKSVTEAEIRNRIDEAKIISFDLFDTLITRRVFSYTDLFEILDMNLQNEGIFIPDFSELRIRAEKELAKDMVPGLEEIYERVIELSGLTCITALELKSREEELDFSVIVPRKKMWELLKLAVSLGKPVFITTDTYYDRDFILKVLKKCKITGYNDVLISCEEGVSKQQGLFLRLIEHCHYKENTGCKGILHIGDDTISDINPANSIGIDSCKILSPAELFDELSGIGLEPHIRSLSDRLSAGFFISKIFNDPFIFEKKKIEIESAFDVGYLFFAPLITDFVFWMKNRINEQGIEQVLFSARDGFLIKKLFDLLEDESTRSVYFLTSRIAAIRAGVENKEDIDSVDEMKFFGSLKESDQVRFGINANGDYEESERDKAILLNAKKQRENYLKYIDSLHLKAKETAFFDFVAKGTAQFYLSRLLNPKLKGFYFMQNEPEYMEKRNLSIESFFMQGEKDSSAVFGLYYILEVFLTSPEPQIIAFDEGGNPVFAKETRNSKDIQCIMDVQRGIKAFFEEYTSLLPKGCHEENKALDESILSMINHVKIRDEAFLDLKIEDPFFGRYTDLSVLLTY